MIMNDNSLSENTDFIIINCLEMKYIRSSSKSS